MINNTSAAGVTPAADTKGHKMTIQDLKKQLEQGYYNHAADYYSVYLAYFEGVRADTLKGTYTGSEFKLYIEVLEDFLFTARAKKAGEVYTSLFTWQLD